MQCYGLDLSAETAVLLESDSNTALFCKEADKRMTMASTTKIMTALLTIENANLNSEIVVNSEMVAVEGTSMGLLPGDSVSVRELCFGMLLPSGNDAANTAAYVICGSIPKFADMMNKKAMEIGMTNTHFMNPSGLTEDGHFTTAYDMALLGSYAIKNREFFNICSTKSVQVSYGNPPYTRTLTNHNKLLKMYEPCVGIKTGFTKKSGRCLVSAAKKDGVTLIAVTLNASDDWNDHIKLFEYGFSHTECVPLNYNINGIKLKVVGATKKSVGLKLSFVPTYTRIDKKDLDVVREIYLNKFEYAPVKSGKVVGTAIFKEKGSGRLICTVPIETVEECT
ncbi:MAG: D-alanyl-D-alanine carboxypeptidase [Oscillospiraceae bacterium]|nr:D-alanyl-D-alanine carboxypeptidase [Oscillospiraceae bacterium]